MAELFVIDADFKGVSEQYPCRARTLEGLVHTYAATLQSIVNDGILQGDAAAALLDFADAAEGYLGGELEDILARHQTKTASFVDTTENDDDATIS